MPGGNTITFSENVGAGANNPAPGNGINSATDSLTIVLDPTSATFLFSDLVGAGEPNLRIGLHVQAIGTTGQSDSYVTGPVVDTSSVTPVPLPAGIWLFGGALAGLGALKLKRRRKALSAA